MIRFAMIAPLFMAVSSGVAKAGEGAELVEVHKIWDAAPHNAFTDLIRFRDRWFCAFREGQAHVSPDGAIRILTSIDGVAWESAARIASPTEDLRDSKLSIRPDGRLMLLAAAALRPPAVGSHQTDAWSSADGREWGSAVPVGERDVWLWRATWHEGRALAVGYGTGKSQFARLYTSREGEAFDVAVPTLFEGGYPNEAGLAFLTDGTALCLLRRDGSDKLAQLGRARPPYTDWSWAGLGRRIGGPALLQVPDGRIIAGVRLMEPAARTAICRVDLDANRLVELVALPSGGDTSYPGLVFHDGLLWVSYYDSREGKASIYLARIKLGD